jgi:hypothetical protein
VLQTVNCGSAAADGFLQQALGKDALGSSSETRVVLVCSKADVEAQQQELAEVARLAEASGLRYQLMLVSAPDAPEASEPLSARRRSLLAAVSGFGPYKECGPVCQTQVGCSARPCCRCQPNEPHSGCLDVRSPSVAHAGSAGPYVSLTSC